MSIKGEEGSMTKDLSARLTALREALLLADEDWAATELDAILASLPAEQEPRCCCGHTEFSHSFKTGTCQEEWCRCNTFQAAAPRPETPVCEHDIGEYGCPKCEPQAETPVDDEK